MACSGDEQSKAGHRRPAAANEQAFSEILERGLNEADPRLAGMTRLTEEEIRQAIVGRTIVEDRREVGGMPHPQGESFSEGDAVEVLLDLGIFTQGRYTIRDNALCVTRGTRNHYCRALFRDSSGRLFQLFFGEDQVVRPIRYIGDGMQR